MTSRARPIYVSGIACVWRRCCLLNFFDAYLTPRDAQVVIQARILIVLESRTLFFKAPCWATVVEYFCADVSTPASSTDGREAMFADDRNASHEFDRSLPASECQEQLERCRRRVHSWGRAKRVSLDASKEHTDLLHPSESLGEAFKLLGCVVELDLRMHSAIEQVLSKIRPKITAILRTRG